MMQFIRILKISVFLGLLICGLFLGLSSASAQMARQQNLSSLQRELRQAGDEMLETLDISYVYGGGKVGDLNTCNVCNTCLEQNQPAPKQRLKVCPTCSQCSLDCSHFTQMVYSRAGLAYPYLTTAQMLSLSAPELERKYGLIPVGYSSLEVIPGDMLVYNGHVIIVESLHPDRTADVIHATGGKDLKGPGQGIQRERFAKLDSFRGELLRVLRHKKVESLRLAEAKPRGSDAVKPDLSRLRRVEKRTD